MKINQWTIYLSWQWASTGPATIDPILSSRLSLWMGRLRQCEVQSLPAATSTLDRHWESNFRRDLDSNALSTYKHFLHAKC